MKLNNLTIALLTSAAAAGWLGNIGNAHAADTKWRFGMITDSQRGEDSEPGSNGVGTIMLNAIVADMYPKNVSAVISAGDQIEGVAVSFSRDGMRSQLKTWLSCMAPFTNAGIPVMAVRGNHEAWAGPYDAVSGWRAEMNLPSGYENELTYAFTSNNALFLAIDEFTTTGNLVPGMKDLPLSWMSSQFASSTAEHRFVYGHAPLYGRNHDDGYTGSARTNFINTMVAGGVKMYISGHDHQYSRSMVLDDAGNVLLLQLILPPSGEKTYGANTTSDPVHNVDVKAVTGQSGYAVTEVWGPKVTVTVYGTPTGNYTFSVIDRFSYYDNGKEYYVKQGGSYAGLAASVAKGGGYLGSSAKILAGTNSDKVEYVAMGFMTADNFSSIVYKDKAAAVISDVFEVCGLENNLNTDSSDTYVLELSFQADNIPGLNGISGLRLAEVNDNGVWTVLEGDIIMGAWNAGYGLGTYGIDVATNTMWGVLDHQGQFAVISTAVPEPLTLGMMAAGLLGLGLRRKRSK